MEFAGASVSNLFLSNRGPGFDADLTGGLTVLGGEKLDLYVPSEAILEPISPAEEDPDDSIVLTFVPVESTAEESDIAGDVTQSNHLASEPGQIKEENPADCSTSEPGDTPSYSAQDTAAELPQVQNSTGPKNAGCSPRDRVAKKMIPPKKDRLEPLKVDMSRRSTIPLTSSQLSLQCLECHIIFSDDKSKQRHIKMSHPTEYERCVLGDSLFACYVCEKYFTCSTELMEHQRTHKEKLPFKCPVCGEAFGRSTELTSHKKVHFSKQEGGYTCSDCGKLSKTLTLLKYHQRRHTGERPYICIHKGCGKRFSMSKALQKHLEEHENAEADGNADSMIVADGVKKRRKRGLSAKKFACLQCDEVFKTTKSQLKHIKTKHSSNQNVVPANSTVLTIEPSTTQTPLGEPPVLCMDPIGQVPQQVGPVGVEEIKKLIEKFGNVQKVNQLVILGVDQLPLQTDSTGQTPGIMKPLHFSFTEPAYQPEDSQQTGNDSNHQGVMINQPKQSLLLASVGGAGNSEKSTTHDVGTMVSSEYSEKPMATAEIDIPETPLNGQSVVQYEIFPKLSEGLAFTPPLDDEILHTTEQQLIRVALDVEAIDMENASPFVATTSSSSKETVKEENLFNSGEIGVSEEASSKADPLAQTPEASDSVDEIPLGEMLKATDLLESKASLCETPNETDLVEVDPSGQTSKATESVNVEHFNKIFMTDSPEANALNQTSSARDAREEPLNENPKAADPVENQPSGQKTKATDVFVVADSLVQTPSNSLVETEMQSVQGSPAHFKSSVLQEVDLKEQSSSEDMKSPILHSAPQQDRLSLEQAPCGESSNKQEQNKSTLVEGALPIKKKPSKRDVPQKLPYTKGKDECAISKPKVTQSLKLGPVAKTKKKRGKAKGKALIVCFGPKETKRKASKHKRLQISKTSLCKDQHDLEPHTFPASEKNNKQPLKQKKQLQTNAKGKNAKTSAHVKSLDLSSIPKATVEKPQRKAKKRKLEIKTDGLVKRGRPSPEIHQDKMTMPKKKKHSKFSEAASPINAKVKITKKKVGRKNQKLTKPKEKGKKVSEVLELEQIKQQALLLLKGHKQPQLKVHKLDAKTTGVEQQLVNKGKKKEATSQAMNKKGPRKKLMQVSQKKKKVNAIGKISKNCQSKQISPTASHPEPSSEKQKVARKRKAPTRLDQEIALSPPYSRVTIGCHDCGKNFSEVSALQEHMASMHAEPGVLQPNMTYEVSEDTIMHSNTSDGKLTNMVQLHRFELQVSSDWDAEAEMRELGLEDRGELSFPALNPSPSLQISNSGEGEAIEMEDFCHETYQRNQQELSEDCRELDQTSEQEISTGTSVGLEENAVQQKEIESHESPLISDLQTSVEEVKEEVPLDTNLTGKNKDTSSCLSTSASGVFNDSQEESSNNPVNNFPTPPKTPASNQNSDSKEASLPKKKDAETNTKRKENQAKTTRGRGRGGRGRGRRQFGKRNSNEDQNVPKAMETNEEDCRVVFEFYSLTDNVEQDKGMKKVKRPRTATKSIQSKFKKANKVQEPCEIRPDGASLVALHENGELNSSCHIDVQEVTSVPCWNEPTTQDKSHLNDEGPCSDVKLEGSPSDLTPQHISSNEGGYLQGVQVVLVKAEDHVSSDASTTSSHVQPHHATSPEKSSELPKFGDQSTSPTFLQSLGQQCVFYPVKEEDGEIQVQPPPDGNGLVPSEVPPEQTRSWGKDDETSERRSEEDTFYHFGAEEGSEQQINEDLLEFLSHSSETEENENLHSEPEVEAQLMSCYRGDAEPHDSEFSERETASSSSSSSSAAGQGFSSDNGFSKPVEYFLQYFGWSTWREIAACTQRALKTPVTGTDIAQFVGIHVAMGTLKFPCLKLYWEDHTRVPLIADAMSASRFSELSSNLRLANQQDEQQSRRCSDPQDARVDGPPCDAESGARSRDLIDDQADEEGAGPHSHPFWRVRQVVRRVQEGCRALRREGNHGVDLYRMPFHRFPTHALHHAVMVSAAGLVVDFSLHINDCSRERLVERMVSRGTPDDQGTVFLCKPELSTPSMLEHLLELGVRSAGKVGGARGQVGDEFVTPDGKLKLFRCHHGFILSAVTKEKSRSSSLVSGFERAIKAANLNRDLRSLYRTPCASSSAHAWPQSVLWDLVDLALVNSWLQYKQDQHWRVESLSLMAFRLEISKALILSSSIDTQDSSPPYPPSPTPLVQPAEVLDSFTTPLPDAATRYDGSGHWPEQLPEGEGARCRFGGCERTSRVRCLKCCVFLCISRNHNCFLRFHSPSGH